MSSKSLMLVSQSNTGSTWFASAIRIACPGLRTSKTMKEWFNPVLNWEHQNQLATVFGSEMHSTVKNLARKAEIHGSGVVESAIQSWDQQNLDFTKENYLAWQIDHRAFTSRFDMIGLLGEAEDCFPPQRIRVMIWYDCWFQSLMANGCFTTPLERTLAKEANTCEKRALVGWQAVHWRLSKVLTDLNVPIVSYRALTTNTEVALETYFDRLNLPAPLVAKTLARVVSETKVTQEKSPWHQRQWQEPFAFLAEFRDTVRSKENERRGSKCDCEDVVMSQTSILGGMLHHDVIGCGGLLDRGGLLDQSEDRIG